MATQSVTVRWRTAIVALLLLFAVSIIAVRSARTALHASDFVQLLVSPTLSERGDMLVQVLVTRDAENQWMKVTAESEAYYSSSEMELDGEYSARVKVIRFRDVPAGWYEVTGTVFDHQKKIKGQSRRSVLVFPR